MTTLFIALRETIEISVIVLLLVGVYREHAKVLIASAAAVVSAGIFITLLNHPLPGFLETAYTGIMFYSFIMILLISFISGKNIVYPIIAIVLALLSPSAQFASVVLDEFNLTGAVVLAYVSAGVAAGALIVGFALRLAAGFDLRRYFGTGGVMVFLASFCFVFGGLNEFDNSSVITFLQKGLYKFLSYIKELLITPEEGAAGIFESLFSERFAMALTAIVLFTPPVYVFIRLLLTPEPSTDTIEIKAEKRKVMAFFTDELIRNGTPLLIALLVSIVMLHSANLAMNPKYDPEPIPVVAEGIFVTIPLADKFGDISDGRIRKYSIRQGEEVYILIVIMRPDSEVVAALDACEICPENGYMQRGEHVICNYCGTPIPVQSIGLPGGCNPIPVKYIIQDNNLILEKNDIVNTYNKWIG